MIELIRNYEHSSKVATYVAQNDDSSKELVKLSYDEEGIADLKRELAGWEWYYQRLGFLSQECACRMVQENERFYKIRIDYLNGTIPDYQKGLSRNEIFLLRLIEHYVYVWPVTDDLVPLHGDFSLGNAIFNGDSVVVFDWEHFQDEAVFYGFDVMYLLVETLFYSLRRFRRINEKELEVFANCWQHFQSYRQFPDKSQTAPICFIRQYMSERCYLWGSQYKKFPILSISDKDVGKLDCIISNRLNQDYTKKEIV